MQLRANLLALSLLLCVINGRCENCSRVDNDHHRGFVSTFIKYLDNALDFLFQALFGGETKPLSNSEDPDADTDADAELNRVSYKGFHLLRIWPHTDDAIESLKMLGEQPRVQLWLPPLKNMSVDVILPPNMASAVKNELTENDIEYSILSNDIEKMIVEQNPQKYKKKWLKDDKPSKMTWSNFHPLEDIYNYLEHLQSTYSDIVDLVTIGKSSEGREMRVLRISSGKSKDLSLKPAIWIDGGIHAREWISPAVALFIIRQLVEHNKSYKNMIDDLDWYILPLANPDGYVFTHEVDRLWRKSRSANEDTSGRYFWDQHDCKGVDLNRNWDHRWNEVGASDDPCHETYAGRAPFSEPETRAMSNFIKEHRDRIIIYLTLHSYSQMWLMPWSSTKERHNDYDDLLYMGRKAIESLKKTHGTNYNLISKQTNSYPISGNNSMIRLVYDYCNKIIEDYNETMKVKGEIKFLTLSSDIVEVRNTTFKNSCGCSDDWAKSKVGIKYSYTIELRDKGTYGYLLPPTQILPTGKEIFTAIRTLTRSVLSNMLKNSKNARQIDN